MTGSVELKDQLAEAAAAATAPIRVEGPGLLKIVAQLVKQSVIEAVQPKTFRNEVASPQPINKI